MKKILLSVFATIGLISNGLAQNYDSTGTVRLWAPKPEGNLSPVVVPGYGPLGEGAISNSFTVQTAGGCFPAWTYGFCVVKNGSAGYSVSGHDGTWHNLCPVNTYQIITGFQNTTNGSVCGGD